MGKSEYLETVGARIKARRKALNLTQLQLADKSGYTSASRNTAIQKIESGWSDLPISRLMRIAEALETDPKFLLTGKRGEEQ